MVPEPAAERPAIPETPVPGPERLQRLAEAALYAARELQAVLEHLAATFDVGAIGSRQTLSSPPDWSMALGALRRSRALLDMSLHYGTQRLPRFRPVALRPVLARVAQVTRTAGRLARSPVHVEERYAARLPMIRADESLLEASLVSLASGVLHAWAPGPADPALACDLLLSASAALPGVRITISIGGLCSAPATRGSAEPPGLGGSAPSGSLSDAARAALTIARASIEAQGGHVQWLPSGTGGSGADILFPPYPEGDPLRPRAGRGQRDRTRGR